MKRNDKRLTLHSVLQGQTSLLRHLKQQREQKQMPYIMATGIVDLHRCPADLLDIHVLYHCFPTLSKQEEFSESLEACIDRYNGLDARLQSHFGSVGAMIWLDDYQYEEVPLQYIQVQCRWDYKDRYVQGGTVGDLRRYHRQCSDSLNKDFLFLKIEPKPDKFEQYEKRLLADLDV